MPTTEEQINGFIAAADANTTMWQNKKNEIDAATQANTDGANQAIADLNNARTTFDADAAAIATTKTNADNDAAHIVTKKGEVDGNAAAVAAVVADVRNGVSTNADLWRREAAMLRLSPNQAAIQSGGTETIPDGWAASSPNITFSRLFTLKAGSPTNQDAIGGNQAEFDKIMTDLGGPPWPWQRRDTYCIRVSWAGANGENFFQSLPFNGGSMSNAAYIRRVSGSLENGNWGRVSDAELPLNTWRLAGSVAQRGNAYHHRMFLMSSDNGSFDILLPAYVVGTVDFDNEPWRWGYTNKINDDYEL